MPLRDFYKNKETTQARIPILQVSATLAFLLLLAGLWKVQILRHNHYSVLAERNQIRSIRWVAPRGNILDRYGRPLADNRPSFTISVLRKDLSELESSLDLLKQGLQLEPDFLRSQIEKQRSRPRHLPLVLKEEAGIGDISFIEAHRHELPIIQVVPHPLRNYPEKEVAAHLLGYVSEVSESQLESGAFGDSAKPGDTVGQKGVERVYDRVLRGVDGKKTIRVDSRGREIEAVKVIEPKPGNDLRLTIDIDIQRAAEQAFGDKAGAAVAVDPRSGEVLCLLSRPAFDPNTFATRISRQKWNELLLDPRKPMHNRAIQSRFPPGSVFKIFMAVAGLQEGVLTSTHTEVCTGGTRIYGRRFACWKKGGHGRVDLHRAIVSSCNVFFYRLGRRLGIERIADNAKAMGLGYKTGIDLLGEDPGLIPSPEWKQRIYKTDWYPGETISVAIGQGAVSLTPIQLARALGGLGLGGVYKVPHVVPSTELNRLGKRLPAAFKSNPPLESRTIRLVSRGLWGVVNEYGTGRRAAVQGFDVCGKTGTAQVIGRELRARLKSQDEKFQDNAWFVGFAPRDFPEIAAAVFVEQGGSGGTAAAPVLQAMFQVYFDKHKKNQPHSEGRPEHIALSLPSGRAR
jgi:penicillin-binding protein 2